MHQLGDWRPPSWWSYRRIYVVAHLLAGLTPPRTVLEPDITALPFAFDDLLPEFRADLVEALDGDRRRDQLRDGSELAARANAHPDWLLTRTTVVLLFADLKRRFSSLNYRYGRCCPVHNDIWASQYELYLCTCWLADGYEFDSSTAALSLTPTGDKKAQVGRATNRDPVNVQERFAAAEARWGSRSHASLVAAMPTGLPRAIMARAFAASDWFEVGGEPLLGIDRAIVLQMPQPERSGVGPTAKLLAKLREHPDIGNVSERQKDQDVANRFWIEGVNKVVIGLCLGRTKPPSAYIADPDVNPQVRMPRIGSLAFGDRKDVFPLFELSPGPLGDDVDAAIASIETLLAACGR